MTSYYTMLILLSCISLGVLCILVRENGWIPIADKRLFYITYCIIGVSAMAEWFGIRMSGDTGFPGWALRAVKCVDYILTPMAGGAMVAQMKLRNRWGRVLIAVLLANAVFQILSCFNGWMIVIDAENRYVHGPLYPVYMAVYMVVIGLTMLELLIYGKAYRRQNRASLYSVVLLVVLGTGMQEMLGGEHRTAYIALTMGAMLMFIHLSEFYQMSTDEHMRRQHSQLMQDALTGVFSRHAYVQALEKYGSMPWLPDDLAAFIMDINGLKAVNDKKGHDAGDELIVGAAQCIVRTFGDSGQCFRTGGDEFVVLGQMAKAQADSALERLQRETKAWRGSAVRTLSLSAGYALASDHEGLTVENLVTEADRAMYAAKAAYYRKSGRNRRKARR